MFVTRCCRKASAFAVLSIMLAACGEDRSVTAVPVAERDMPVTTGPASLHIA